jgi:hypothetical protein
LAVVAAVLAARLPPDGILVEANPTGFRTLSRPTGDFPARVVVIAALTDSLDRSLISALTIWGDAGNEA